MPTASTDAPRDNNRQPVLMGVADRTGTYNGKDYVEGVTPVPIAVDPTTNRMKVDIITP